MRALSALPPLVALAVSVRAATTWSAWGDALAHHLGWVHTGVLALLVLAVAASAAACARRVRALLGGGPLPSVAFELRVLLWLVVGCSLGFAARFPAIRVPYAWATWGLASAVLAVVCCRRPRQGAAPPAARAVDVLVTSLALGLLLVELALRLGLGFLPSQLMVESSASAAERVEARRPYPGQLMYGFPCNSRGYLDRELDESNSRSRLVVSIGDSFSSAAAPYPLHFTSVCEREWPGTEVYNVGVPAIATPEYLELLVAEALPLEPDAIVVNLFLGNDLQVPPEPEAARWLDEFFDRETIDLTRTWQRLTRLLREESRQGAPGPEAQPVAATGIVDTPEKAEAAFPWVLDPLLEKPTYSQDHFEDVECRRAVEACSETWVDYPRVFGYLADMVAAAGDTPVVFTLIPDEFQTNDELWELVSSATEIPLDRERPQRVLTTWCRERGIAVLDYLPLLRAAPPLEDGKKHLYHLRDTHWNSRGHGIAGRELARFLRELLR